MASSRGGIEVQSKLKSDAEVDAGEMKEEARGRHGPDVKRGMRVVGGAVMLKLQASECFATVQVIERSRYADHSLIEVRVRFGS